MSKFLEYPIPTSKLPHIKPKGSARVLTSSENIKLIAEKERQKLQIVLERGKKTSKGRKKASKRRKVIEGAKEVPETATKESP